MAKTVSYPEVSVQTDLQKPEDAMTDKATTSSQYMITQRDPLTKHPRVFDMEICTGAYGLMDLIDEAEMIVDGKTPA